LNRTVFVEILKIMSEEESTDRKLGRISPDTCALLICDIQEKFRPAIYKFDHIVSNTKKLGIKRMNYVFEHSKKKQHSI